MAVDRRAIDHLPQPAIPRWPTLGVLALAGAKLADAATTAVALTFLPLVEFNPLVRTLIAHVGILPGVLIGSGLAIGVITLVTETGVHACSRLSPERRGAARVRYVGYGLPTALFAAAAVYNLALILLVV